MSVCIYSSQDKEETGVSKLLAAGVCIYEYIYLWVWKVLTFFYQLTRSLAQIKHLLWISVSCCKPPLSLWASEPLSCETGSGSHWKLCIPSIPLAVDWIRSPSAAVIQKNQHVRASLNTSRWMPSSLGPRRSSISYQPMIETRLPQPAEHRKPIISPWLPTCNRLLLLQLQERKWREGEWMSESRSEVRDQCSRWSISKTTQ